MLLRFSDLIFGSYVARTELELTRGASLHACALVALVVEACELRKHKCAIKMASPFPLYLIEYARKRRDGDIMSVPAPTSF